MELQKRKLGKTGVHVTVMGLGGEGVLRTYGMDQDACRLINAAIDLGVNYCESARAYSGSESYYGLALKERRKEIFLTSKSHARDKKGALEHLQVTLKNMKTDHLDLWQVHDVRTEEDIQEIFGPRGAIEAFAEAKQKGLARFVGVTGHQDPEIIARCIEKYEFDTVLLPVNPAEPRYKSFLETVIPLANRKQMGVIGMKVYLRGLVQQLPYYSSMKPFLRFALSQPITAVVIGCDSVQQLRENVEYARSFSPMSVEELDQMTQDLAPFARQLMYYKPPSHNI
jgi:aryl-alcohol dehydrogenase-like predicted oxidoreductase